MSRRTVHYIIIAVLLVVFLQLSFPRAIYAQDLTEEEYMALLSNVALGKSVHVSGDMGGYTSNVVDGSKPTIPFDWTMGTHGIFWFGIHNVYPDNMDQYIAVYLEGVFVVEAIMVCAALFENRPSEFLIGFWDLIENKWKYAFYEEPAGDGVTGVTAGPLPDYPMQVETPYGQRIVTNAVVVAPIFGEMMNDFGEVAEITVIGTTLQGFGGGGQYTQEDLDNAVADAVAPLQTQIDTLTAQNQTLQGQVDALTTQNQTLQGQVDALTTQNQTLQGQVDALTTQNQTLQGQVDALTTQNQTLQGQVDALTTQNQTLQGQVDALTAQNQTLQGQVDALTTQNQNLRDQVDALTTQNQTLQDQVDACNTQNQNLQSQVDALTTQNQNLQDQVDALTTQNQNLQDQVDALTTQNQTLQDQVDACNTQNQNLQDQVDDFITSMEQCLSGLEEIIGLLATPQGQRSSTSFYTGYFGDELNKIIEMLLAPQGSNISETAPHGKKK